MHCEGVVFLSWKIVRDEYCGSFTKFVSFEDVGTLFELIQQVKLTSVSGLVVNLECGWGVVNEALVYIAFKPVTEELGGLKWSCW